MRISIIRDTWDAVMYYFYIFFDIVSGEVCIEIRIFDLKIDTLKLASFNM